MAEKQSSSSIMWITIVVAIVLVAIIYPLTSKKSTSAADAASSEDVEIRIQPVARIELAKAAPAASAGPKDAATIYNTVCGACHNTGAAGAPKIDDKAAWAPRVATGKDALYKTALGGKGAMPAKGGVASLSDDEIKATVDYILGKVK